MLLAHVHGETARKRADPSRPDGCVSGRSSSSRWLFQVQPADKQLLNLFLVGKLELQFWFCIYLSTQVGNDECQDMIYSQI